MAQFFTSPTDLVGWLRKNASTAEEASAKILNAIGDNRHESDIVQSIRRIFSKENCEGAASVLFNVLAQYGITEEQIKTGTKKGDILVAAESLEKSKFISAEEKSEMIKQAQIMRQPGEYPMELRVCPKLLRSVGGRIISTYNCRHYCLDSVIFDEDPSRVYCAEALWRRHVMDKFSSDWKDLKSGELVGGYINSRFYSFPTAGTPDNPDVPRDQGNKMNLKPDERTRQPRQHEWSTERRLQEEREKGSTESIILAMGKAPIRLGSMDVINKSNEVLYKVFSESIDLHNQGVDEVSAVNHLSEKYAMPIQEVVVVQDKALAKFAQNMSNSYAVKPEGQARPQQPPAPSRWLVNTQVKATTPDAKQTFLNQGTVLDQRDNAGNFTIVDPASKMPTSQVVNIAQPDQGLLQNFNDVQESAKEVGLT